MPAPPDERAIVGAVLAGDRDAFRQLVEREGSTVVRACQRILGDLHEAEDAAQEAFVIAFRSLSSWRGEGSFGAWVGRIAVRIALRQAGRRKNVTWLETTTDEAASGFNEPVSPLPDPAVVAIHVERATAVRSAVAALEEPYREVVALRFFAEQSLAEIAELTGRPLGTVKTHLHRGLLRLRERLPEGAAS
jgi:RNA polymerase sigma-70 factor, ECF subfamily